MIHEGTRSNESLAVARRPFLKSAGLLGKTEQPLHE